MRSRSLQYLGALICLLYLGQDTIVPTVHLFRPSTEASSSTSCEKGKGQEQGEPGFDTICTGGLYKSPVFDEANIVGGIVEVSPQAILTDNSSPRAPPFLLL